MKANYKWLSKSQYQLWHCWFVQIKWIYKKLEDASFNRWICGKFPFWAIRATVKSSVIRICCIQTVRVFDLTEEESLFLGNTVCYPNDSLKRRSAAAKSKPSLNAHKKQQRRWQEVLMKWSQRPENQREMHGKLLSFVRGWRHCYNMYKYSAQQNKTRNTNVPRPKWEYPNTRHTN